MCCHWEDRPLFQRRIGTSYGRHEWTRARRIGHHDRGRMLSHANRHHEPSQRRIARALSLSTARGPVRAGHGRTRPHRSEPFYHPTSMCTPVSQLVGQKVRRTNLLYHIFLQTHIKWTDSAPTKAPKPPPSRSIGILVVSLLEEMRIVDECMKLERPTPVKFQICPSKKFTGSVTKQREKKIRDAVNVNR